MGAKVHIFLLRIIGQSEILEKPATTTVASDWIPEALTIPPETITTEEATTEESEESSTEYPKNGYSMPMKDGKSFWVWTDEKQP